MRPFAQVVLVLQGGGALGAYQSGVYPATEIDHYCPLWGEADISERMPNDRDL